MRKLGVVAACCFICVAPIGCGPRWSRVEPGGGGFSVLLPSSVSCEPSEVRLPSAVLTGTRCVSRPRSIEEVKLGFFVLDWYFVPDQFVGDDATVLIAEFEKFEDEDLIGGYVRQWQPTKIPPATESGGGAALLGGIAAHETEVAILGKGEYGDPPGWKRRVCLHGRRLYSFLSNSVWNQDSEAAWRRATDSFQFLGSN